MRRRWNVPNLYDAIARLNLNTPYPEVHGESSDQSQVSPGETSHEDACADFTAGSADQERENVYLGLSDSLEPFLFLTTTGEETEQNRKERLAHQTTVKFYRPFLFQQGLLNKSDAIPNEMCRICRDTDSKESFMSPCNCKGTLALVHLSCLERWLAESDTSFCELCGHQYTTVRTPRYGITRSIGEWLRQDSHHDLIFDAISFCAFTPLAFTGTYLGFSIANAYCHSEGRDLENCVGPVCAKLITLGLVSLMATIDFAFLMWFFVRAQQHITRWYSWWRRHSVVRVILPPEVPDVKSS